MLLKRKACHSERSEESLHLCCRTRGNPEILRSAQNDRLTELGNDFRRYVWKSKHSESR
jgi:hypothetical protein